MNIVFWLGVILAAVILWFSISWLFPRIGESVKNTIAKTREDINTDYEEETNYDED